MNPAEYGRSFDGRISELVTSASRAVPAFAVRLAAAEVDPTALDSAAELDRLPVLTKDQLLDLQAADRPFGGMLAKGVRPRRVFQSPGPLYEPEFDESDPWRWAPALRSAGFDSSDIVLVGFGYHLSPAGAMFEEGARALGCTVVPAGIGSMDLQVQAAADLLATGFIGLPSYLNALLEKADELGLDLHFEKAFVTAEPLPLSLRDQLESRVATVRQGYGTAEAGNLGYECAARQGFHVPEDALVQVVDISTGEARWDGREGEVVVTLLHHEYPLIRFGTGDLSAFITENCACGIATPRLKGWLGRVGDAVKVRGMFLHPRQAAAALEGVEGVASFRFVVERIDHRDVLRCEIVPAGTPPDEGLVSRAGERIRSALRFNAQVELVERIDTGAAVIEDCRVWD